MEEVIESSNAGSRFGPRRLELASSHHSPRRIRRRWIRPMRVRVVDGGHRPIMLVVVPPAADATAAGGDDAATGNGRLDRLGRRHRHRRGTLGCRRHRGSSARPSRRGRRGVIVPVIRLRSRPNRPRRVEVVPVVVMTVGVPGTITVPAGTGVGTARRGRVGRKGVGGEQTGDGDGEQEPLHDASS